MTDCVLPEVVSMFGTLVVGKGERYVIDLKKLDKPLYFVNPKDRGTKYGDQYLKGNGEDILILNGVSKKQELMLDRYLYFFEKRTGKGFDEMNTQQVKELLDWLETNSFNDRYCSDTLHKSISYQHVRGHIYKKLVQPVKAAELEVGQTYKDGTKTQEAAVKGALLIVDKRHIAHITNVPEGYQTFKESDNIITYKDAFRLYADMKMRLQVAKKLAV